MDSSFPIPDIMKDDLSQYAGRRGVFTTFGEVMVRETPADLERLERTRTVHLSLAGSEYTLAMGLSRLGIPSRYITRVPANPYGFQVRNTAREQGIDTEHIVWAPKTEPIGRLLYELGRTPRKSAAVYQRKYSAASRLGAGMVDWATALQDARLFHTSGITFGLANHSGYDRNHNYEAFTEALAHRPADCQVGLDFNYRATLWSVDQARATMSPIVGDYVNALITTIEDMAQLYGIACGKWSAKQISDGDMGAIHDDDIRRFGEEVIRLFDVKVVAITIRYPDSFEQHRWEAAAVDREGNFFRSPAVKPIVLLDRLGGGDTWNAGFYYGLLTAGFNAIGLRKGVLVGDAFTRLKQTLMFDLPLVEKAEVQSLITADAQGGGKRVDR
jgi:2-dehydro-3-deoxygluconokinase